MIVEYRGFEVHVWPDAFGGWRYTFTDHDGVTRTGRRKTTSSHAINAAFRNVDGYLAKRFPPPPPSTHHNADPRLIADRLRSRNVDPDRAARIYAADLHARHGATLAGRDALNRHFGAHGAKGRRARLLRRLRTVDRRRTKARTEARRRHLRHRAAVARIVARRLARRRYARRRYARRRIVQHIPAPTP